MKATLKARAIKKMEYRSGMRADGNSWSAQDILVETIDEQYPKKVLLKFFNKQTDPIVEGNDYQFEYEVESREYNGRWYTEAKCWSYTALEQSATAEQKGNGVIYQKDEQTATKKQDYPF
jgi:hypothetical protein